jgi:hypothetical protein
MTESSTPTLSSEQLSEVLRLIKGADSVELKLTVPDGDHASAVAALEMDVLDAQIRQVVFFDTADLTLNQHGVVVRGRRVQGRDGDTVVKLRPIDPADVPAKVRKDPGFGIEVDAMPGGFVCSGSMKATLDDYRVKETFAASRPLSKLLTGEQRRFFADHAPEGVGLDDLARLGPINVLKLKFTPGEFGRRLVAELWFYPDATRLLELSTKCTPAEAFQVAAELKAFLASRGIDLSGAQATKTRLALDYFAGQLAAS